MRLVVISGRSGSGKSTALHVMEDVGFTCIDNLPAGLLPALFEQLKSSNEPEDLQVAVGIDARNLIDDMEHFPGILDQLKAAGVNYEVIYLDAGDTTLLKRFSETRRKHPLSTTHLGLKESIDWEREILEPIAMIADRVVDTTSMTLHQLRDLIKKQVSPDTRGDMTILFESFGFKRGVPVDVDLVFDARCLPNPYWKAELRAFTGQDRPVVDFLEAQVDVAHMFADITGFLERWIPKFQANNRSYLTVAIGCTGGQHRSVYLSNKLAEYFKKRLSNPVQVRHRELD
ncbi:RNase adapter RapZ [Porticoccaceae bacterium LTM1]|nr:RNase adapter RapZ [Porticoccaceae bacterium LTM1]